MKKTVFGILCILAGIILVLNNFDLIDRKVFHILISWQSLLIGIGFINLFDRKSSAKEGGAIMIIIGLLFLLPKIFEMQGVRDLILPAIIIGVGLFVLIKSSSGRRSKHSSFNRRREEDWDARSFSVMDEEVIGQEGHAEGCIKREFAFSGLKEKWTYHNIRKIEVDAVFSGVEIDLSQIDFAEDAQNVKIKISSAFSSVTLYIPSEWNIVVQKTGVFGGFTDKRPVNTKPDSLSQSVILELEAVFGGGEIKYYE